MRDSRLAQILFREFGPSGDTSRPSAALYRDARKYFQIAIVAMLATIIAALSFEALRTTRLWAAGLAVMMAGILVTGATLLGATYLLIRGVMRERAERRR